jgi:PAS domain S-box-containing protein
MNEPIHRHGKILIVDDQEANVRLVERILKQAGFASYRSLTDSRQTSAVFHEFQPDLILLDLMMPHLDGVAVIEELWPLTEGTYLPILVLTADTTVESRRRALAAGAKDFLTKPLDADEVLLRINNLLETRFLYQRVQRRAAERIQEQAELLDRANDAIMVRDLTDRILYWNRGAERLYGWTAEEAVGREVRELLYHGATAHLDDATAALMREGNWEGEIRQVNRDGREVIVESRWTLVLDEEERPKSRLIIDTDVSDKKKLEAQLIQAQRMEAVGRLAGGVAHDFNNLLTVIIGFSEMVLGGLEPQEPTHELIKEVHDAGHRAAALTRQLLAFSRKQVMAFVVLNVNSLISETQKMLCRLIGEDIHLTTSLDPELGLVKADPGQIEQVLMNLVVNARDAMPHGGQLTIETQNVELEPPGGRCGVELASGPYVIVAVSDTGCGMDEAIKVRIFEPFFTTKEMGKGTGLGLATVYGIVKQSGGAIEVESEPGLGTTFRIYLPRQTSDTTDTDRYPSESSLLPCGTETVLLVEDEDCVRTLGALALRSSGYTVLEAPDGEEALAICQRHAGDLDLLVTDVVMPKMNGRQLADQMAAMRPDLKVLYISGYADDTIVHHGVGEAGLAFLQKPFTPSVLVRKVHEVLGQHCAPCSAVSGVHANL